MPFVDTLLSYLPLVLEVLGALTLLVGVIAKSTATDSDDKLAAFLSAVHDFLAKLTLHSPILEKKAGAAVVKANASVVIK